MTPFKKYKHLLNWFSTCLQQLVDNASRLPVIGLLVRAGLKDHEHLSKDMAASIAYFTFLSLFPLFLGLFALGGYFLESDELHTRLIEFLIKVLPASAEFVTRNIESLIRYRGAVGLASILVLMWSASKMVGALSRGINNALEFKRPYAVYFSKLRNFGLTLTVSLLVFSMIALTPIVEILSELQPAFIGTRGSAFINVIAGHVAGFALSAILLSVTYLLVPFQRIPLKELAPGILVATCAIELGKELFAAYVGKVSPYHAVYGSLSSIIVLLIWLYFSARVVLYGTEVVAVYRKSREECRDAKTED